MNEWYNKVNATCIMFFTLQLYHKNARVSITESAPVKKGQTHEYHQGTDDERQSQRLSFESRKRMLFGQSGDRGRRFHSECFCTRDPCRHVCPLVPPVPLPIVSV